MSTFEAEYIACSKGSGAAKWLHQLHRDMHSVSNSSNLLVRFRVRVGTGIRPFQQTLPNENPDCCNWADFTTKNSAFQTHNFGSN